MRFRSILLLIFAITLNSVALAQNDGNNTLFRRARAYNKAGKIEEAIQILQKLNEENPENIAYLKLLKDSYTELGKFQRLLTLLQRNLSLHPDNWRIETEIIDTYIKIGENDKAFFIINKLSEKYPESYPLTRTIASVLSSNRLYDETVKVYKNAQKRMENPAPVTRDLANYHASRLNYTRATNEYIKFLNSAPQNYGYVRQRLSRFNTDSSTINSVLKVLDAGLKKSPENQSLRQLVADYQFRTGNFEQALAEIILLEENSDSDGQILFQLIENLKHEKEYEIGIKAARKLMSLRPDSRYYPKTYFMLAELHELKETNQNETKYDPILNLQFTDLNRINESPGIPKSIAIYDSLSSRYKNSLISSKALFRMGEIYFMRLQNLDEAEKAFNRSMLSFRGVEIVEPALTRLADISLERGDLESAIESYHKLAERTKSESIRLNSKFIISKIEYFSGEYDSALYHLNDLIIESDFEDPIMNDVLELSILLEIAKSDNSVKSQEAFKLYSKGDLLTHRRRYSEAQMVFQNLSDGYPETPISDDALFLVAELSAIMGRYEESVESFDLFLATYPESDLIDKALLVAGEISEIGLKKYRRANTYFETLLIDHPRSLYADIARQHLRKLAEIERVN